MRKPRMVWLPAAALLAALGCGGPSPDDLVKQSIRCLSEAADEFETITNEASAKSAEPKLRALVDKMAELNKQAAKKERLTPEDMEKLNKDNEEASKQVFERLREASKKAVTRTPAAIPLVQRFQQGMLRGTPLR